MRVSRREDMTPAQYQLGSALRQEIMCTPQSPLRQRHRHPANINTQANRSLLNAVDLTVQSSDNDVIPHCKVFGCGGRELALLLVMVMA